MLIARPSTINAVKAAFGPSPYRLAFAASRLPLSVSQALRTYASAGITVSC